ncbi:MAG: Crp/Fnr family transcriptional regulator [Alphaproteobacteria bacterium]|nr:Crp/Fnr family transcriptional regulator [Alphaproteobacteria bacterium]
MQNIPVYKAEPHLRRLAHDSLRQLARRGRLVRFKNNSQVITQGQIGHEIFIVLDGRLEAYIHSNGRKERRLTLATLHSGDIFGEIGAEGGQRSASVCTVSPSLCAMVPSSELAEMREHDLQLQALLALTANARNRHNTQLMAQALFNDIYTRMIDLLMSLATVQGPRTMPITERITHQDIANRLGCSREMVSRLLKDLERGQYISRRKDHTLVLHPPLPVAW